jgi:uncharacterized membrane protein YadS
VIGAEEDETSYAVGCITLFGLVALLLYPWLAHFLFGDQSELAGLFLGTAIHDTSQVAGASLMYEQMYDAPAALNAATVTKLVRNVCMLFVIPLSAYLYRSGEGKRSSSMKWSEIVPVFVLWFVAMAGLRTSVDLGFDLGYLPTSLQESWSDLLKICDSTSSWCLTIAMAAVGMNTSLARILKRGLRPLFVGLFAAATVGAVSWAMVTLLYSAA